MPGAGVVHPIKGTEFALQKSLEDWVRKDISDCTIHRAVGRFIKVAFNIITHNASFPSDGLVTQPLLSRVSFLTDIGSRNAEAVNCMILSYWTYFNLGLAPQFAPCIEKRLF